jgi:predicted  nucleic acid-binding Zn-ribbon protein
VSRKAKDPRLIALLDKQQKARAEFERCYTRFRRITNRMEKARQQVLRLGRSIDKLSQEVPS